MGLFSSLTGGGDTPDDDGPDAYRVVRKTEKGGWKPVEGFDEMEEPIDKGTFEYNAAPLKPGEYRLFAIEGNLQRQPPEGSGWTLEVDGDTRDNQQDDEIAELKREIRALRDDNAQQNPTDPQEAVERQKANLQLAALQSEDFLKRYGDKIIMGMFDADTGGGGSSSKIEYDDWQENPVGASLFQTMNMVQDEPEQIERFGEAIGRAAGAFAGKAADGYAESGGDLSLEEAREQSQTTDDTDTDEQQDAPAGGRSVDAGPSDLGDLGVGASAVETEDLAADLADARTTVRRAGAGEQDRPTDGPDTAPTDADADSGPTDTPTPDPTDTAPAPEPDATDASSPDPDPMTASPDDTTTGTPGGSSDERAAAIAEEL